MIRTSSRNRPQAQALVKEAPWTLIGPGSVIHGELLMAGNVLVYGRVEGILFTDGEAQVALGGLVEGGIHAHRVVIEGACEGRVEASDEVVLRAGSVMRGDIEARVLTIDEGARFLGHWLRGDASKDPRTHRYENDAPGHA